jgi:beta-galactosidase
VPVHVFADALKAKNADVLASWESDFLEGAPACTERRNGKGRALYYGSFLNLDAARYLMKRLTVDCGLSPLLSGVPASVEVTCRSAGDSRFYFLLNHTDAPVTVQTGAGLYDMLKAEPFPPRYTLKPFAYKVLKQQ